MAMLNNQIVNLKKSECVYNHIGSNRNLPGKARILTNGLCKSLTSKYVDFTISVGSIQAVMEDARASQNMEPNLVTSINVNMNPTSRSAQIHQYLSMSESIPLYMCVHMH